MVLRQAPSCPNQWQPQGEQGGGSAKGRVSTPPLAQRPLTPTVQTDGCWDGGVDVVQGQLLHTVRGWGQAGTPPPPSSQLAQVGLDPQALGSGHWPPSLPSRHLAPERGSARQWALCAQPGGGKGMAFGIRQAWVSVPVIPRSRQVPPPSCTAPICKTGARQPLCKAAVREGTRRGLGTCVLGALQTNRTNSRHTGRRDLLHRTGSQDGERW